MNEKASYWFLCTTTETRHNERKDAYEDVKVRYLVEAVNYTDAETTIIKHVNDTHVSFTLNDITKKRYEDILGHDINRFYDVKVKYTSGEDKVTKETNLVRAVNIKHAFDIMTEKLEPCKMIVGCDIIGISESLINEFIPLEAGK